MRKAAGPPNNGQPGAAAGSAPTSVITQQPQEGTHRNTINRARVSGLPSTFKGSKPELGAVIGTKEDFRRLFLNTYRKPFCSMYQLNTRKGQTWRLKERPSPIAALDKKEKPPQQMITSSIKTTCT